MSKRPDNPEPRAPHEPELPAPKIKQRRGFNTIWVIPLIAAGIGAWLWFDAVRSRGPEITIEFVTAEDLEAGKTKLKFKDVEIGQIESVRLKDDLSGVIATARMQREAAAHLHPDSRFWVVRPRIGLQGVTGLGTLLSGAYIATDPGTEGGAAPSHYVGLEHPPRTPSDAPGLQLVVHAESIGSLGIGAPVYYRGVVVGHVDDVVLREDGAGVELPVYIEPEYAHLVLASTRFWNASFLDVEVGSEGVHATVPSLQTLISGGVEFATPPGGERAPRATAGTVYSLYPDRAKALAIFATAREYVAYFTGSVRGLEPGAAVELHGIRVGTVRSFAIVGEDLKALTRAVIALELERIGRTSPADEPIRDILDGAIRMGARLRLATANIVTGGLYVDLVVDADSPAELHGTPDELEVPTLPSLAESLQSTVKRIPEIIDNLADAVESARAAIGSVEASLSADSSLRVRLSSALDEIAASLRSVRHLADMLERQPEALIKGKPSDTEGW
jgi:paraquat-inducible protein B